MTNCYISTNLQLGRDLIVIGRDVSIDSKFKHRLFRKYTDIHNGIFTMSM